tara:strand:+ start:129 stop:1001 length:873 start_codon:yes stop_codon:yes gene_type:complete
MAIKLGGGGGSASQIDEVVYLNNDADTVTLDDERVYLKGGVYETTVSTYPLAKTSFKYLGTNFTTAAQDTTPQGITWDGTYFWVGGSNSTKVLKYNSSGVFVSSFSVSSQVATVKGVINDGTYIWVLDSYTNKVHKYSQAGVYQNVFWTFSEGTESKGLTFDGTHVWVSNQSTGYADHYKYTVAGVYTNVTWSSYAQYDYGRTLAWTGTHFWVADANGLISEYTSAGVYTGKTMNVNPPTSSLAGITYKDGSLFLLSNSGGPVYELAPTIGIGSNNIAVAGVGQNYVRVK